MNNIGPSASWKQSCTLLHARRLQPLREAIGGKVVSPLRKPLVFAERTSQLGSRLIAAYRQPSLSADLQQPRGIQQRSKRMWDRLTSVDRLTALLAL